MSKSFKERFASSYTLDAYGAFVLDKELILKALQTLFDEDGYTFLVDITAIDYLHVNTQKERFALIYLLRDHNFQTSSR